MSDNLAALLTLVLISPSIAVLAVLLARWGNGSCPKD